MWHYCFYNQSAVQQGETVKRLLLAYAVTSPLDATGWDQWFHLTFSLLTRTFFTQTLTSMLMQSRISCIYTQAHISSHDFVSFVLQPCIINLHSFMLFAIWPSRSLNQVLTLRLERVAFYRPFSLRLTESLWQNSFYCWSMIKLSFTSRASFIYRWHHLNFCWDAWVCEVAGLFEPQYPPLREEDDVVLFRSWSSRRWLTMLVIEEVRFLPVSAARCCWCCFAASCRRRSSTACIFSYSSG